MQLLHNSWLLFTYELRATRRNPTWALIGLFQPLCYLFLFAPLLSGMSKAPNFPPGGVFTVFTPGLLILLGVYSTLFSGFNLVNALRTGVIERLRVTPVSRFALVLGRVLRDVLLLLLQSLLLILISLPLGIHINAGGVVLAFVLLVLLGTGMASCSYALALQLKNEGTLSSLLTTVSFPLILLSGIILPLSLAPAITRVIADFDPLSYLVNGVRLLFTGQIASLGVLEGFVVSALLALLALLWARNAFNRAIA